MLIFTYFGKEKKILYDEREAFRCKGCVSRFDLTGREIPASCLLVIFGFVC